MDSFWNRFGIVLGSFWYRFGKCWDRVGIALGSFWDSGIVVGSFLNRFGIGSGSFRDRFGIVLESFWNRFGIVFPPPRIPKYGKHAPPFDGARHQLVYVFPRPASDFWLVPFSAR